jgi:hypothetical protein
MTKALAVPPSPMPPQTHNLMVALIDKFKNKSQNLAASEKLLLYRFFRRSFNRALALTNFLVSWLNAFCEYTDKIINLIQKSLNTFDIMHLSGFWFQGFCEILDEYLLLKFGAVITEYDRSEHQCYLIERNSAPNVERFPHQEKFSEFTSCSLWGFRDLIKTIEKVCFVKRTSF